MITFWNMKSANHGLSSWSSLVVYQFIDVCCATHMLQIYDRVLVSRSEVTLLVLTALAIGLLFIYGLLEVFGHAF